MADDTVEPRLQAGAGSAVPQRSREFADDIAGHVRSGSPSGSPASATDTDDARSAAENQPSTMAGQWPLPRRIRPHDDTLDDFRGQTD